LPIILLVKFDLFISIFSCEFLFYSLCLFLGSFSLTSEHLLRFYYFVLFVFVLSVIAAFRIINSPFGRVLHSLKDNEDRARSIGYNTYRFKLLSFMISAAFASLAGGLYAIHSNFVPLETLHIDTSLNVVIMTLVGGVGTLYGPIFGAMFIVILKNILSNWLGNWNLIMGLIFILSVLTLRKGLLPVLKEHLWVKK